MLSRNNWKEQVRQQEPKKQRFTIKKLTIGVASVLIGFTFMGMSASANTQTTSTTDTDTSAVSHTEGQNTNAIKIAKSGAAGNGQDTTASEQGNKQDAQQTVNKWMSTPALDDLKNFEGTPENHVTQPDVTNVVNQINSLKQEEYQKQLEQVKQQVLNEIGKRLDTVTPAQIQAVKDEQDLFQLEGVLQGYSEHQDVIKRQELNKEMSQIQAQGKKDVDAAKTNAEVNAVVKKTLDGLSLVVAKSNLWSTRGTLIRSGFLLNSYAYLSNEDKAALQKQITDAQALLAEQTTELDDWKQGDAAAFEQTTKQTQQKAIQILNAIKEAGTKNSAAAQSAAADALAKLPNLHTDSPFAPAVLTAFQKEVKDAKNANTIDILMRMAEQMTLPIPQPEQPQKTILTSVTWSSTIANLHRTTDDNTNIDVNNSPINTINFYYDWDNTNGNFRKTTVYKLNADGKKFVNTTDPTDSFDASGFKYEWIKGYAPNTRFGTGTGTVLAQNNGVFNTEENYQMKYKVTDPSVIRKLHLNSKYSSSIQDYFNFWGATTGQPLTFKQNQDISNLNQDQYRQLINVTDLGANGWNGTNVDPSTQQAAAYTPGTDAYTPGTDATKTFSMAWAPNGQPSTATVADGVKGTVRINFHDGTYLDVPATINVEKNNADTTTLIAPSKIVPSYDGTKVVDTPFYNNSRGTNSNLIDNQSKTGQYTFYFTAKDASGKEYASSYAAAKGNPTGVVLNSILDKDAGAYDPNSLEFHFYYQNNTDQDQTINYTLRMADYLNPYKAGRPESSLVPDGSRISDVKVTSKQGNTYDISSVTKTLDGVKSRDGDLRYVGDVPVNLTVKANDAINLVIPFVLNTTAKKSNTTIDDHNEFSVRENGQQTGYLVVRSSTYAPLFSEHKIYPLVNVGNNNYTHDYPDNPGAFDLDPSVYLDNDFMDGFWDGRTGIYKASKPTNLNTVYNSYTYTFLLLDNYQKSLTKHGFTVAFSDGKPVPYYMYLLSKTGSKVVDKNGNPVQGETKGHPYFEVVPVILLNQDETYTTKTAPTAWDPSTMVNKVADPTNYRYWDQKTDSAVRRDNTAAQLTAKDFKVTITKDGQDVKPNANGKYNLSKPGIYTVTYSKDFNGTTISNSGQITVVKDNADQYIPAYKDTTVAANSLVDTGSPSFTKDSNPVTDVPSHTYAFKDGTTKMTINDKNSKNPVTVTIDKTSGAITFTAPDDATEYDIPVTVTYEDGSSNTATAKVVVYKSLDPTKVDPTNPEYKDMFKTVTRDIVTTSVSGQQTTEAQSLDFGRTMTIYGNGHPATYGKWEAGKLSTDKFTTQGGSTEFASENITPVDGYTSYYKIGNDGQKVNASAVPSASALDKDGNPVGGTTVYVGYDKNNTPTPTEDTTVTYTFYDETDKKPVEGHDVTVTGQPGTDQKVNLTTPEGYKLAEGQTLPTSVMMPKANETITINLVHATKDIKPNDPGVNPSDPVYADMFKTVTRTIKVNNPDRMVDTTTQQVNFNRTKTIDEVTDEVISYGNWTLATGSTKDWGQFNVPQLDGFISYVDGNAAKEVAEENVTADTADVTVEVTYKNSDNNGNNTNPGDDGNHNTNPGDNGNHNTNPGDNGNHNTNPGNNNGINNGTQNGNGNKTVNTNVTDNGNGDKTVNTNVTDNGNGNKTVNTNVTDNSNGDNGQNNKQALPQTGNTKNDAAVAGLGLAGLLAMLGLGGLKKKRN